MSAFGFLFAPAWMAAIHLGHLLVLLAALAAVAGASGRWRPLAAVLLLAALGWVATVVLSAVIAALPTAAAPSPLLAWAPIGADLPGWAAVVVGVVAVWRGGRGVGEASGGVRRDR